MRSREEKKDIALPKVFDRKERSVLETKQK
jgi:hypothetical protein